jgi:LPS-assembly protein
VTGRRGIAGRLSARHLARLALVAALALVAPGPAVPPAAAQMMGLTGAPAQPRTATLIADQVLIDPQGRLVAQGSVEVWQGSTRLTARRVVFDQTRGQLSIEGPMVLSDGPERIAVADQAELSSDLREGLMQSARLVLHQQLQMSAQRIERREGRFTQLDAVIASTCDVCAARPTPLWEVRAARVIHDQDANTLRFDQAQFRLYGVPLLTLPRMTLPDGSVDRARGFLRPELRFTSEQGAALMVPYFIPFGDHRDLTLMPQMASSGMVSLGWRWRQATQRGGLEFGGQISRDNTGLGSLRGYGYLRALYAVGAGFRLSADVTLPSDRTYLETYGISDDGQLRSHVTLERIRRDQAIRARALLFRSLRPMDNNDELPGRVVQADWDQRHGGLPIGGELSYGARLHAHQRPSGVDGDAGRDVARLAAFARWQRAEVLAGGILTTFALQGRVDHVRVSDDSAYPDPVTRGAAEAMIEFRWPWARVDAGGGHQVIEPVAQLIRARRGTAALPNDDHRMPELDAGNLFAPLRYTGLDAPDDGTRANLGLRWQRHAPGGWGVETLVGRVVRRDALTGFDPDHRQPLGEVRSDWLLASRVDSPQGMSLGVRLLMDDRRDLSRGEANLTWARPEGGSVVSRYLYVHANVAENRADPLNEWSLDLAHRFPSGWLGRVGWDYDIGTGEWANARTGLEFRNECLAVDLSLSRRFASSTNLTASTRFGLRVELLGLSGRSTGPSGRSCRA